MCLLRFAMIDHDAALYSTAQMRDIRVIKSARDMLNSGKCPLVTTTPASVCLLRSNMMHTLALNKPRKLFQRLAWPAADNGSLLPPTASKSLLHNTVIVKSSLECAHNQCTFQNQSKLSDPRLAAPRAMLCPASATRGVERQWHPSATAAPTTKTMHTS